MDKIINKLINSFFLVLIFFTPLIMFHKTSELFEFNKMLFIYFITISVFSLWLLRMVLHRKIIFQKTYFDLPIFLFLFSQIISTILSIDRETSIFGYYGRFNGGLLSVISYIILFYAFVSNFDFKNKIALINKALFTSLLSSLVVILWNIPDRFGYDLTCLVFTGDFNLSCWTDQFKPLERAFSTLGQPNWLGTYLLINFFIAVYFLQKSKKYFYLLVVYLFANFSTILFTRSKSTYFAFFIGMLFLAYRFWHEKMIKSKINYFLLLVIISSILFFKTGISSIDKYLVFTKSKVTNTIVTNNSNTNYLVTDSFDIRKIVWKGAIDLGFKYPFFGTGVETFAYSYYFTRPVSHNVTSEWDFVYNKAHNEFLNYFATTGFFGLFSYLLISIYLFVLFFKNTKNDLIFFLTISYLTILITNFFGFSTTSINVLTYLILAICSVVLIDKNSFETVKVGFIKNYKTILSIIAVLLFYLASCSYLIRYFLADINYSIGDNLYKVQEYVRSTEFLEKAIGLKNEHIYMDKLSLVYANLAYSKAYEGDMQKANDYYKLANSYNLISISKSPKNIFYYKTRAKIYFVFYQISKDKDFLEKAITSLDQAIKISPTDPKLYQTKAVLYFSEMENQKTIDEKIFNEALQNINKSIELKNNFYDGYFTKGLIYKIAKKNDEAKKVFDYILKNIAPGDADTQKEIKEIGF